MNPSLTPDHDLETRARQLARKENDFRFSPWA
jgi:hypothetical protein